MIILITTTTTTITPTPEMRTRRRTRGKSRRASAAQRTVTDWEIAWFGFTGGLLPCPAAIAVLLICLQIKAVTLGVAMVAAFSLGLAITLIAIGLVAAWGTRRAAAGWSGFDRWAGRLPYVSGALVMTLGVFITLRGLWELGALRLV